MRIGINASFLRKPGTGIGQVTVNFLKKLTESTINNQQSTIVLYTEEPIDMRLPAHFEIRNFLPFWKRDDLIRKWLWEKQVAQKAEKDGCDVFLSLYQTATIFPKSFHHVMVVHDLIPRLFPKYQGNIRQRWHWKAVEWGILRASRVLAVSEATKSDLVKFGIKEKVITVVYPDTAPLFRQDLALEEENRVMATYGLVPGYLYHGGGLEVRKNTGGVLQAYKQLVEQEKNGVLGVSLPPLVISGKIFSEDNLLATPVKKLIQELGIGGQVHLLDFIPEQDLPALYKNALFFIYPSFYEGFGLPVLEALHMGTPVLTSENSSLGEVAGDAALYVDPHVIESIASGMECLLKDVSLRKTLSEATKQRRDHFSWEHFVRSTLDSLNVT